MRRRNVVEDCVEDQLYIKENSVSDISKDEEKLLILIAEILVKYITEDDYGKNSVRPWVSKAK